MSTAIRSRRRIAPSNPVPTPVTRQAALGDAVIATIAALQRLLAHPDPAVVLKAAEGILDLEKTRLRHGRAVAGTTEPVFAASETSGTSETAPFSRGEEAMPEAEQEGDDFDQYVEQVRAELEQVKGQNGVPAVITREFAERVARQALDPDFRRQHGLAPRNDECPTNDQ